MRLRIAAVGLAGLVASRTNGTWRDYTPRVGISKSCPNFEDFARERHGPFSAGPLKLPLMRPPAECRTYNSEYMEEIIRAMCKRIKNPDLARLFENTFASTLETAIRYYDKEANLAFVVSGETDVMSIRDVEMQLGHLYSLLPKDAGLRKLFKAIINTASRYIAKYPYCAVFQPPPESGLPPVVNEAQENVVVNPPIDNQTVFDCRYGLDTLASFLKLSRWYYTMSRSDGEFTNDNWQRAFIQINRVLKEQAQGTWDKKGNYVSHYNWTGAQGSPAPRIVNDGNGEPHSAGDITRGLVASGFRPSGEAAVFSYNVPANIMMATELIQGANVAECESVIGGQAYKSRSYAGRMEQDLLDKAKADGGIYPYEINGKGSQYIMDGPDLPNLISLGYLECVYPDETKKFRKFRKTRKAMLSDKNPYYVEGEEFSGISSDDVNYPWPISQISAIFGTDDDDEITERLNLLLESTAGLGLIHKTVNKDNVSDFTQAWYPKGNSFFAEMMLDLARRKPWLIFKEDDVSPFKISVDRDE